MFKFDDDATNRVDLHSRIEELEIESEDQRNEIIRIRAENQEQLLMLEEHVSKLDRQNENKEKQLQELWREYNRSLEQSKQKAHDVAQSFLGTLAAEEKKRRAVRKQLGDSNAENRKLKQIILQNPSAYDLTEDINVDLSSGKSNASDYGSNDDEDSLKGKEYEDDLVRHNQALEEGMRAAEEMIIDLEERRKIEMTAMIRITELMGANMEILGKRLEKVLKEQEMSKK